MSDPQLVRFLGMAAIEQPDWHDAAVANLMAQQTYRQMNRFGAPDQVDVGMMIDGQPYTMHAEKLYPANEIIAKFIWMVLLWAAIIGFWVWLLV